jgi:subtilase family serine protease
MPFHRKFPRLLARWQAAAAALALTVAGTATAAAASSASPGQAPAAVSPVVQPAANQEQLGAEPACAQAQPGYMSCQAMVDTSLHWTGHAWIIGTTPSAAPSSAPPAISSPGAALAPYMAADLQSAYRLPSSLLGSRQLIAIVDAYDDPDAASDLAAYRAANKLPACDAAFPCFEKVNQEGQQGNYPATDAGWAEEESLDVDMASAICPNCKIILVEANDNTTADLGAAENEAAKLGANAISNSYAGGEYYNDLSDLGSDWDHPGIAITAAAGDDGFGAQIPAALSTVIAVGGTSLYRDDSARGWAETAWQETGSGCSINVPKPSWQHDPLCSHRTVADVSAIADPATPVAIYDTYGEAGWVAVGGTSVATPLIAGVYALAGNTGSITPGAYLYAHQGDLFDVTYHARVSNPALQSNGNCGGSYLCTASNGYDGPTGLGTPDGIGGF